MLKIKIECGDIQINPRIYSENIYVSPCGCEHGISTDLFKFRIYAEENKLHVIGACSRNYVPHYSLFCDEIILLDDRPAYYDKGFSAIGFDYNKSHANIESRSGLRMIFSRISDDRVIERFKHRKIHMFKSAYDNFHKLELPKSLLVCEIKPGESPWSGGPIRQQMNSLNLPMVAGIDWQFQRNLMKTVGKDNYMSTQILASKYLNWQFFCMAGSSNLFSVIPAKSIFLREQYITQSVKNIVEGLSPHECWPVCFSLNDFYEDCLQYDVIMQAFEDMSFVEIDFEIVLIDS